MTSDVAIGGERFGSNDLVALGDAEQPFIKGPVTEMAEGQAVARVVIVADGTGNDMGGVDRGVAKLAVSRSWAKGSMTVRRQIEKSSAVIQLMAIFLQFYKICPYQYI